MGEGLGMIKNLFILLMAGLGLSGVQLATAGEGLSQSISTRLSKAEIKRLAFDTVEKYFPKVDPYMLMAMAQIESSLDPLAKRHEKHLDDWSVGLMQTLVNTAVWLFEEMGATRKGRPSFAELMKPEVSMYFGAAYVNWLRTFRGKSRGQEWIVRAYNGGQGWNIQRSNESDADFQRRLAMTANHWRKFQKAYAELKGAA